MANKKTIEVGIQFQADTKKAKSSLLELQSSMSNVFSSLSSTNNLPLNKELSRAKDTAYALQAALQQAVNIDTGKFDLSKFQRSLKQSGVELNDIRRDFVNMGEAGKKAYTDLTKAIVTAEIPGRTLNKHLNEMLKSLKDVARWKLSSGIVQGFQGALQTAYGYAQDLNKSLNDIRIVTGYNVEQMEDFAVNATKAAKTLSTTTNEYAKASLIYFQQGLNDEEVQRRTDTTIKMANVTGEAAAKVSSYMTAVWNNFDNGTKSLEYYADAITALGAATASSSEEIATGLQKFSAVANTVGLSYEYATAALATVTSETRESAETVGTAFKTIFARLESLSLGETLDDDTTMTKYSQALAQVGVDIKESNGQLKDMDQIIDEVGTKWNQISKDQQIALAQTVAGMRQYNNFIALMDNYKGFRLNVDIAASSEGTLTEQQEIYAESWEAARDRVKAAAEDIFNKLLDDDFFITLLNSFEKILGVVSNLIDSFGGLQGILTGVSAILLKTFSSKIADGIKNTGLYVKSLFGGAKKEAVQAKEEAVSLYETLNTAGGERSTEELAQTDNLKQRLNLQLFYAANEEKLTESQKARINVLMQILEIDQSHIESLARESDLLNKQIAQEKEALRIEEQRKAQEGEQKKVQAQDTLANNKALREETLKVLNDAMPTGDTSLIQDQIRKIETLFDTETNKFANVLVENLKKAAEIIDVDIDSLSEEERQIAGDRINTDLGSVYEAIEHDATQAMAREVQKDVPLTWADAMKAANTGVISDSVGATNDTTLTSQQIEAKIDHFANSIGQGTDEYEDAIRGINEVLKGTKSSVQKMDDITQSLIGVAAKVMDAEQGSQSENMADALRGSAKAWETQKSSIESDKDVALDQNNEDFEKKRAAIEAEEASLKAAFEEVQRYTMTAEEQEQKRQEILKDYSRGNSDTRQAEARKFKEKSDGYLVESEDEKARVLQDAQENFTNSLSDITNEIEQLTKENDDAVKQITQDFEEKLLAAADAALKKIKPDTKKAAKEGLEVDKKQKKDTLVNELGQQGKAYDTIINKVEELNEHNEERIELEDEANEKAQDVVNTISTPIKPDMMESFITLTSSISGAVSAITMLSNLSENLSSPDMSGWERFTTAITTIGMAVPMLVMSWKSLTSIKAVDNAITMAALALGEKQLAQDLKNINLTTTEGALEGKNLLISKLKLTSEQAEIAIAKVKEGVKLKEAIMAAKGITLKTGEAAATTGKTAADGAETTGIWAKVTAYFAAQAAAWPVLAVTLLIVAAIAALVGVIALLVAGFKAIAASTPEAKLAAAKEEAKEMATALDDAKNRANELKDAFNNYNSVRDKLSECVKGTKEWNEALLENDQNVIALMQKYPKLATMQNELGEKAIERDENGALKIADWAQEELTMEANKSVAAATTASYTANAKVRDQQQEIDTRNAEKELKKGASADMKAFADTFTENASDYVGKTEDELFEKLKADTEGQDYSDEQLKNLAKELYDNVDALGDLNASVRANTEASKLETEAIKQMVLANVDEVQDSDYTEQIIESTAQDDDEIIDKKVEAKIKELEEEGFGTDGVSKATGVNERAEDYFAEYAKAMGLDGATLTDTTGADGNRTYVYTDAEGNSHEVGIEHMRRVVASAEVNKGIEEEAKVIAQLYNQINDKTTVNALTASVSGDMSRLTRAEKEAIANGEFDLNDTKLTGEQAKALDVGFGVGWFDEQIAQASGYDNVEEYYAAQLQAKLKQQAEEAQKKFNSDTASLSSQAAQSSVRDLVNASKTNEDLAQLTDAQFIAYGKAVETISKTGGEEMADNFNAMVSDLTSGNKEQAVEIIDLVNGIDWTNGEQAANELQASLDAMGVDTLNLGSNWEKFVENLQEDKISVLKYDFEQIRADIAAISKISKDIKLGSIVSDEDYKTLVKYNGSLASMFQMTADGYRYIGEEDLSKHTDDIAEKTLEETLEANARAKAGVNAASQRLEYNNAKEQGILDDDLNYIAGQAADENSDWAKTLDALDVDANYLTELAKQSQSTDATVKAAAEAKIKEFYDQVDQLEADVASGKYDNKAAYEIYATSLNSLEELEAQKQRFMDAGQMGAYNKQLEYLQNYRKQALEDIDRYEDLNKQVDSLTQGLEDLQRARDRSTGNDTLDLLSQEISLTKELIAANEVALRQSESELVAEMSKLKTLGLEVDEYGNITNAEYIRGQYANGADEDKRKEINDTIKGYDEILDKVNSYREAVNDAQDEIKDLWDEYNTELMETISLFDQLSDMDGFGLGTTISEDEYNRLTAYNEALKDYYILTADGYKQIKEISQEDATKAWLDAGAAAVKDASQTITDAEVQLAEAEKASSFDKLTYYWSDGRDGNKNHTYNWEDLSLRDDFTGQAHAAMERIIGDEELLANVSKITGWDEDQIVHAFHSAESGNASSFEAIKQIYAKISDYQSSAGSVDDANLNLEEANKAAKAAKESMIASANSQEQLDLLKSKYADWLNDPELQEAWDNQADYLAAETENYKKLISSMDDYQTKLDSIAKNKSKFMVGTSEYMRALKEEQETFKNGLSAITQETSVNYKDLKDKTKKLGIKVETDDYGNIVNREEILEAAQQKYGTDSEGLKSVEDAIANYSDSNENLLDLQERQRESWVENSTAIKDWNDSIRDLELDYLDQALSQLEDKAFSSSQALALLGAKTAALNGKVQDTKDSITKLAQNFGLETSGKSIDEIALGLVGLDDSNAREKALELMGDYSSSMQEYQDLIDDQYEQISKHFDDIGAQYDKMEDKISHFSDVINSYRDIVDLVGKQNLGDGANEFLKSLGEQELSNVKQSLSLAKSEYEKYAQDRLAIEEKLQNASLTESEKAKLNETLTDVIALEEEAYSNMNEQWANALTVANEIFKENVNIILEEMEKSVAGAFGTIDALLEKYDQQSEVSQRYLADYKQIYELSKLSRNLDRDIDNAQSVKSKQALKELQAEITELQASGTEMSAYDLENLQKRYDLRKAEIALEEAQEAKKTVRLQRNADGNWGYVYTQNADAVAQAEQTYEDKLYALQESSNKYLESTSQGILKTQDEYMQAVESIMNDATLTREEQMAKINETTEFYNEKMKYQAGEMEKVFNNNKTMYYEDWTAYSEATGYKIEASDQLATSFAASMIGQLTGAGSLDALVSNFTDMSGELGVKMGEAIASWDESVNGGIMATMGTSIEEFTDTAGATVDNLNTTVDSFIEKLSSELPEDNTFDQLLTSATQTANELQTKYDEMLDSYTKFINGMQRMGVNITAQSYKVDGEGSVTNSGLEGYDTGGYTGAWGDSGKVAVLHQKELVLNAEDTENILNAVDLVRTISQQIDVQAMTAALGIQLRAAQIHEGTNRLEQEVTIHAEFPNATNHSEIEAAFDTLINRSAQYSNRN